jgi:hypothetical protein
MEVAVCLALFSSWCVIGLLHPFSDRVPSWIMVIIHPRFVTTVFEIRLMSQTNFVLHFFPSLVFFWFCFVFLIIFIGMETFLYLVSDFCD